MTYLLFKNTAYLILLCFSLAACSTATVYKPEIGGSGAKWSHGSVIYAIPTENPILKMKLVSLVQPKNKMLHVRMYFVRKAAGTGEYIDPKELSLSVPDSSTLIYPARIHADGAGKPLIKLGGHAKQAVEVLFATPKGGDEYPYVKLNFKIHYKKDGQDLAMSETQRFDYVDKSEHEELGVGRYDGSLEFPAIGAAPDIDDMWYPGGWLWW
jgi:hypothetical protein